MIFTLIEARGCVPYQSGGVVLPGLILRVTVLGEVARWTMAT